MSLDQFIDRRPLITRLDALARRYEAIASGTAKIARRGGASLQDVQNAARDAMTIREAVLALQGKGGGDG